MKKIMLIFVMFAAVTSCTEAVKTTEAAEKFCEKRGGISYFQQYATLICRDGTYVH